MARGLPMSQRPVKKSPLSAHRHYPLHRLHPCLGPMPITLIKDHFPMAGSLSIMKSASCCAHSATRADPVLCFDSYRSWYVGEFRNDDCLNSEIISLGRYYVDTLAVPPLSSWSHPFGSPPSSPSPPAGSYAPPSSSPRSRSYEGISSSPSYNQQHGQPYSEQHLNEPQSYRTSAEQLPMWLSDTTSGGNSFHHRGIDPQEPRAYLQKGFPPQQGYVEPPPDNYENPGWPQGPQGWQQPQQGTCYS
jgi:hypothetical protein